jgi:glycosyl transferase family 25
LPDLLGGDCGLMFLFQYDQVRVISLASRKDRRREMRKELQRFWSTPTFFDAIRPSDAGPFANIGFHGSYLSHLAVLREATGSVLILEDDCTFTSEARSYLVPKGTDIFYGGYEGNPDGDIIGAHCMGFSANAAAIARDYLSGLLNGSVGPDPRAVAENNFSGILPPIDGAYVWLRRAHPELKTVFAQIAGQRSSRSDCTPAWFDTIPALRGLASIGRRVMT